MNNYVALPELAELDNERLIWRVNLPEYAPAERIGVNVGRLGTIAFAGCFESLRVSSFSGETTNVVPDIHSFDEHGQAMASAKASVSKAALADSSIDNPANIPADYSWPSVHIRLNMAEIDNRVGNKSRLRDPKAWSGELDKALKSGIREAAAKNLVESRSFPDKMKTPTLLGLFAVLNVIGYQTYDLNHLPHETLLAYGFFDFMVDPAVQRYIHKLPYSQRKWSLFMGIHPDRLLAANTLSRTGKLVKAI